MVGRRPLSDNMLQLFPSIFCTLNFEQTVHNNGLYKYYSQNVLLRSVITLRRRYFSEKLVKRFIMIICHVIPSTHFESGPEFVRHEIVEKRIYGGRQVVQDSRYVVQHLINVCIDYRSARVVLVVRVSVDGHQPLRLKRRPADEKRHHHDHCKEQY